MNAYDMPTSLMVGGVEQPIRSGWRVAIDIFTMYADPDFDSEMKSVGLLKMIYPNWRDIPPEAIPEAIEKACEFLDGGKRTSKRKGPRLVDWETDAPLIVPAVNSVAGMDIRRDPEIHWWTVLGWYMSIENSLFSSVLRIRKKRAEGKPLDKQEKDWYRHNQELVDLKSRYTRDELEFLKNRGGGKNA